MAKEWAKGFYNSKAWKRCRSGYIALMLQNNGGMCEVCGIEPGYIVHHKIELTPENINNPDISLNYANLRYDCKWCHDREDNHFMDRFQRNCLFDANGQPVDIRKLD